MDPYIESSDRWDSFHTLMVAALCGQLNARLPERFVASVEEYVWVSEPEQRKRPRRKQPDVRISEQPRGEAATATMAVAAAPTTILLPELQAVWRRYVKVTDKEFRRVVTAVELLSPANKLAGGDRDAYLHKRGQYLAAGVSLVEIDLLRGGKRLPLSEPPPEVRDYYIMVCRSWEHPRADFWTFTVRDPLPLIPVPLADDVAPVMLDLKTCLDRAYDEARYATELHYNEPLTLRLGKADAAWVKKLLADKVGAER
jgi:hypothetical protein